jgi:hypothetical protein
LIRRNRFLNLLLKRKIREEDQESLRVKRSKKVERERESLRPKWKR